MDNNYITSLNAHDVLAGRGPIPAQNEGNKRYRKLVRARRTAYRDGKRWEKRRVAQSIIDQVRSNGGRFLKEVYHTPDRSVLKWALLDEKATQAKVKQVRFDDVQ